MSFDAYTLQARLAPVYLTLLPLAFGFAAWLKPGEWKMIGVAAGLYVVLGVLMSQVGRDLGKKKESSLFLRWGGKPTTRLIRFRHTSLSKIVLLKYRARLAKLCPEFSAPSEVDEERDPAGCDAIYEGWAAVLRERTRDDRLVAKENCGYGFRRNYWAMRPAGILCVVIGVLLGLGAHISGVGVARTEVGLVAVIVVPVVLGVWLTLRVNADWVKLAANAYAERLLASLERCS